MLNSDIQKSKLENHVITKFSFPCRVQPPRDIKEKLNKSAEDIDQMADLEIYNLRVQRPNFKNLSRGSNIVGSN